MRRVEDPSPGQAVVEATVLWFKDDLQVASPASAEG